MEGEQIGRIHGQKNFAKDRRNMKHKHTWKDIETQIEADKVSWCENTGCLRITKSALKL